MDANRTPCSISIEAGSWGRWISVSFRAARGKITHHAMPRRDFSPWLTPEALSAFDPDAREAGEYMLEIAKAAAVNRDRRRRYGKHN